MLSLFLSGFLLSVWVYAFLLQQFQIRDLPGTIHGFDGDKCFVLVFAGMYMTPMPHRPKRRPFTSETQGLWPVFSVRSGYVQDFNFLYLCLSPSRSSSLQRTFCSVNICLPKYRRLCLRPACHIHLLPHGNQRSGRRF